MVRFMKSSKFGLGLREQATDKNLALRVIEVEFFLYSQNKKTILDMQNVQFKFQQVLRHYYLQRRHLLSLLLPKMY